MYTDKTVLYEALVTIKAECTLHVDSCTDCPFYKDGYGCQVETNPYVWELDKDTIFKEG